MDITGCITVPEEETNRFDNHEDNGVSLLMVDNDDPLDMDEDGDMYIEDNPKILGVYISRRNIPLLQKVLELIDDHENKMEVFSVYGIQATFTPDFENDEEKEINKSSTDCLLGITDKEKYIDE